ncbi:hypothetical protein FA95DRAFT_1606210 [Auriscalpium vulgare]|uniref:Uncharacterized protein n=1 Tax=Auriscalpium vulgare TaxID=40419 RepID=A0ACB8RU32_9AGAM|nr:hypothetical protein FA95DRAFT_1606210 [Auriscalpium vulgare]
MSGPYTPTKSLSRQPATSPLHALASSSSKVHRSTPQSQRVVSSSQISLDDQASPIKLGRWDEDPFLAYPVHPALDHARSDDLALPPLPSPSSYPSPSLISDRVGSSPRQFKVPPLPIFSSRDATSSKVPLISSGEIVPSSQSQYPPWDLAPFSTSLPKEHSNTPFKGSSQGSSQRSEEPSSQYEELELDMSKQLDLKSVPLPWVAEAFAEEPTKLHPLPPTRMTTSPPLSNPASPISEHLAVPAEPYLHPLNPATRPAASPSTPNARSPSPVQLQASPEKLDGSETEPESDEEPVKNCPNSRPSSPRRRPHLQISRQKLRRIANLPNSMHSDDLDFLDEGGLSMSSEGSSMPNDSYVDLGSSLPSAIGDFLNMLDEESQS